MGWLEMPQSITEPILAQHLKDAKGDLFIAASLAGCTPIQLRRAIKASDTLQGLYLAIERVKANPDYDKLANEDFEDLLNALSREYRLDGLEAIHEIATIQASNAAEMEVKLKAAIQLRGTNGATASGDSASILAELNHLYAVNAPRIKSIRVSTAQIEYQGGETQEQQTITLEHDQIPLANRGTGAP
jgi:hypothetical protein